MSPEQKEERRQDRRESEPQSDAARRRQQAQEQNRPDQPGGYKRVDARSEDEQRAVEKAVNDDLAERQRAEDERKRDEKAGESAKSAQKPISKDGQSTHPSRVERDASKDTVTGLSSSEQRQEIERGEQETGRGVSSLNQGPSDTRSADPHNPPNYAAARGDGPGGAPGAAQGAWDTGGTGQAPPQGERPGTTEKTTEKPSL